MVRDLRPVGPVEALDRALVAARRMPPSSIVRAWIAGGLVAAVVVAIYFVERVEGVGGLRPVFALALAGAWILRAMLLAPVARDAVRVLWDGAPIPDDAARPADVARTASIAGIGLWVWLWPLVGASLLGPIAIALVLPLLSFRGLVAPSWIARAGCTSDGGVRAFVRAAGDTSGRRFASGIGELLVIFGMLGAFANLYVAASFAVLIARSMLGLDLALVEAFLSPSNTLVLIAVAAATLVLFEPLRAAISAVAYVDARARHEGLDLVAAVDAAIAAAARRGGATEGDEGGRTTARDAAAVVLLAVALGAQAIDPSAASAQLPPPPWPPGPDETETLTKPDPADDLVYEERTAAGVLNETEADRAAREAAEQILAQPEFRELEDARGQSLRKMIERLLEILFRPPDEPLSLPTLGGPRIPMPPAWSFLVLGGVLVALVAAYLFATRARERRAADEIARDVSAASPDPRDRAPGQHLDDAARLAEEGRLREALRALYLATLVALDRRRLISFDPTLTNWQYMRQMPEGEPRRLFASFTRTFDHKWYGDEPTTRDEYVHCRELADRICAPESAP